MTIDHAYDPADSATTYAAAFARGDATRLDELYEPGALVVPTPGTPMTGPERVAAHRHLLSFGLPIQARTRHAYVADDIALLVVDWSLRGTAAQGFPIDMSGTATDVVRRGLDGRWRYVIDNPFGTA